MKKGVFSLPINPKIDRKFAEETFIPFLIEHKHLIYDLYFTCRIPPFSQDAMGDILAESGRVVVESESVVWNFRWNSSGEILARARWVGYRLESVQRDFGGNPLESDAWVWFRI